MATCNGATLIIEATLVIEATLDPVLIGALPLNGLMRTALAPLLK